MAARVNTLKPFFGVDTQTDDRGFTIDEDYVLNRRDSYDPDEEWEGNRDDDD